MSQIALTMKSKSKRELTEEVLEGGSQSTTELRQSASMKMKSAKVRRMKPRATRRFRGTSMMLKHQSKLIKRTARQELQRYVLAERAKLARMMQVTATTTISTEQKNGAGSDVRCGPTPVSSGRGSDGVVRSCTVTSAYGGNAGKTYVVEPGQEHPQLPHAGSQRKQKHIEIGRDNEEVANASIVKDSECQGKECPTRPTCKCQCMPDGCNRRPGRLVFCLICKTGVGPGCCLRKGNICHLCEANPQEVS